MFVDAVQCHQAGRLADAERLYRAILDVTPDDVAVMNNLGLIVPPQEAEGLFTKALSIKQDYIDALINLGKLFVSQKRVQEAGEKFGRAIEIDNHNLEAWINLGDLFASAGKYKAAAGYFREAVKIAPDDDRTIPRLVASLQSSGSFVEADIYRKRIPRPQPLLVENAEDHRRNVLILVHTGGEITPHDKIIPRTRNTRIIWWVDCATDDQIDTLPIFDVVFNAVGSAETGELAPSLITRFRSVCRRPILNPPERVAVTRRDLAPVLLGDIPNVVVPAVLRLGRNEVDNDLADRLTAAGVTFPLLARPIAGHGGAEVTLVENPEQLAAVDFSSSDAYYFIAYHDYQSPDGYYRKFRNFFVNRKSYPYHLAISPTWLVHYFSADMLAEPWKREEERRFLETPALALGQAATEAIDAIGRRLDLDFAGIDYAILPDGRVLVFEANPTMTVLLPDAGDFPYKVAHVESVFAAVEDLLNDCATAPSR
jgi:tetratricopeptide (TPR) repeat protein